MGDTALRMQVATSGGVGIAGSKHGRRSDRRRESEDLQCAETRFLQVMRAVSNVVRWVAILDMRRHMPGVGDGMDTGGIGVQQTGSGEAQQGQHAPQHGGHQARMPRRRVSTGHADWAGSGGTDVDQAAPRRRAKSGTSNRGHFK